MVVILSGLPSEAGTLAAKLTEAIIQTGRELVVWEESHQSRLMSRGRVIREPYPIPRTLLRNWSSEPYYNSRLADEAERLCVPTYARFMPRYFF